MTGLSKPEPTVPGELVYVMLAERFGCSPADVLNWPEEVYEDVSMYLAVSGNDARRRQVMGL